MEKKTSKTSPELHKDFEATPTHKSHKQHTVTSKDIWYED